jgi:hypothetical protein
MRDCLAFVTYIDHPVIHQVPFFVVGADHVFHIQSPGYVAFIIVSMCRVYARDGIYWSSAMRSSTAFMAARHSIWIAVVWHHPRLRSSRL